jgi:hypothetical protein
LLSQIVTMFCHSNLQEDGVSLSAVIQSPCIYSVTSCFFFSRGKWRWWYTQSRVRGLCRWSGQRSRQYQRRLYKVILRWNCNRTVVALLLQRSLLLLLRPSLFKAYVARKHHMFVKDVKHRKHSQANSHRQRIY